jgi:hypothetical protein
MKNEFCGLCRLYIALDVEAVKKETRIEEEEKRQN